MPTALNKISFQNCRLYTIVDRSALRNRDPIGVAEVALRGGADVVQWRDKTACDRDFLSVARRLRELTLDFKVPFVVNDRVAVALLAKADALHLGQEDLPLKEVRALVGDSMLIGRSTHSLAQAQAAQASGADYLGVGPIFSTPTKPTYPAVGVTLIEEVSPRIRIPWFAIGGIDLTNISLVLSAGATRVAVVRAVTGAENVEEAARAFKSLLRPERGHPRYFRR